jgi:hypothetical protein
MNNEDGYRMQQKHVNWPVLPEKERQLFCHLNLNFRPIFPTKKNANLDAQRSTKNDN